MAKEAYSFSLLIFALISLRTYDGALIPYALFLFEDAIRFSDDAGYPFCRAVVREDSLEANTKRSAAITFSHGCRAYGDDLVPHGIVNDRPPTYARACVPYDILERVN